jgi:hypothetical protein
MTDTPEHIKQLQLKIWLSKTPSEKLIQFLNDNEAFFNLVNEMKKSLEKQNQPSNNNLSSF